MAVEMEPRFYGLRNINEKEGSFEADFGIKVRWGPSNAAAAAAAAAAGSADALGASPPMFHIAEALHVAQLERSEPAAMAQRPLWNEMFVRCRSTSLARFQLQSFPYDVHKLKVVVRVPRVRQQGIQSIVAVQESKPTPRAPDMGLQDWLVLRQRCYMRTVAPGIKWFLRCNAPLEFNSAAEELGSAGRGAAEGRTPAQGAASGQLPDPWQPRAGGRDEAKRVRQASAKAKAKLEFVMEFLVQRRATFWGTSVYLPLLAMELIVPMVFAMPLEDLASRLMLAVTLVLAPTVFKTALTDRLPSVGYLTTMERHFIFAYIFILASCLVHTAIRVLVYMDLKELGRALNVVGAIGSLVLLAVYHSRHYLMHFQPYLKRLSMFERRSFYAPPVVQTMEAWSNAGEARPPRSTPTSQSMSSMEDWSSPLSSVDASDCEGEASPTSLSQAKMVST